MPAKGQLTPIEDRIANKIVVDPQTDCHVWQGSHSSQGRYPTLGAGGRGKPPIYVHRHAAGPAPGFPPPDGSYRWEVHHTCLNRSCVNPDHVKWLTHREHMAEHAELRSAAVESAVA